jgi:hypothetical protein
VGLSASVRADLEPGLNGQVVYDTDLDITFVADANLHGARMSWSAANDYIDSLNAQNFLGSDNWRLPVADPNCSQYGCDNMVSELGHLFYEELNGQQGSDLDPNQDDQVNQIGPFTDIQQWWWYWTSTPVDGMAGNVWAFSFSGGSQDRRSQSYNDHFVWPVTDGKLLGPRDASCVLKKIKASAKLTKAHLACAAKAVVNDKVDPDACVLKTREKLPSLWGKAEAKAAKKGLDCTTSSAVDTRDMIAASLLPLSAQLAAGVNLSEKAGAVLGKSLLKAAEKKLGGLLKAEAVNVKKPDAGKLQSARAKVEAKFMVSWDKAIYKAQRKGAAYAGPPANDVEAAIDLLAAEVVDAMKN